MPSTPWPWPMSILGSPRGKRPAAARVVPAPTVRSRPPVELQRPEPAGARVGRTSGLRDRRVAGHGILASGIIPEAATRWRPTPASPFGPQRAGRPFGGEDDEAKGKKADAEDGPEAIRSPASTSTGSPTGYPVPRQGARCSAAARREGRGVLDPSAGGGVLGDEAASPQDDAGPRTELERFDLSSKLRVEELSPRGATCFSVTGDGRRAVLYDRRHARASSRPTTRPRAGRTDDTNITVDLSRVAARSTRSPSGGRATPRPAG